MEEELGGGVLGGGEVKDRKKHRISTDWFLLWLVPTKIHAEYGCIGRWRLTENISCMRAWVQVSVCTQACMCKSMHGAKLSGVD